MDSSAGPSRLYKYCPPSRIERVLAERTLRFTRASDFNDPFELFPTMDAYLRPLVAALLIEKAKASHLASMRAVMREHVASETLRISLEQHLMQELDDETSETMTRLHDNVFMAIHRMKSEERRTFLASIRKRLDDSFGVLSLSAVPDHILMWSHYADSHKGFALELDARDAFFDQRIFPSDPLRCVRPVSYEHERPPRALFESRYWLRSNETATTDLDEYMAGVLLLTKSSDWSYEQEWRMIIPLAGARTTAAGVHVLDVPPRCVLRVILGSGMSAADRERIFAILEHPDFHHVEVARAVCDTRRFRVLLRDDASMAEKKLLDDIDRFPNDGVHQRMERIGVSGPRFYAAQAALVGKGWIAIPPYERSKQQKKMLALTETGRARVAERREAARQWAESRKSPTDRLLEKVKGAPADRIDSIVAEHIHDTYVREMLRNPERVRRQTMAPEVLRHYAALGDEDEDVRWSAAQALRKIGDANVVEHLTAILKWPEYGEELAWIQDPRQRRNATREEIEEIESNAPLAYDLLDHHELWGSDELTRLAAYALGGIAARVAADEATDALIAALGQEDEDTRYSAAEALGHIGSLRALPELERLATSDEDTSYGTLADIAKIAIRRIKDAQKRGRPTPLR